MMTSFYNLLKYAATGQASSSMTYFDKMRASTLMGGAVQTLTGIPPLSFKADGTPLISWSMKGNGQQTGTPTPDNPVMPEFVGVRTGNLLDESTSSDADATHVNYNKSKPIYLLAGQSYTFSCDTVCNGLYIRNSTDDSNLASANSAKTLTYTPAANVTAYLIVWNSNGVTNLKPMLNLGSTALPYEPFGYKIPISCGGETTTVYLGQVSTVRRIKKLVLNGTENIEIKSGNAKFYIPIPDMVYPSTSSVLWMCSHYKAVSNAAPWTSYDYMISWSTKDIGASFGLRIRDINYISASAADFKAYLAAQYANGTPVTIWYVLSSSATETGIVNEPLCKIGDCYDTLTTDTPIPTAKGSNTLSVDTTVQPSEVSITGNIKPTT